MKTICQPQRRSIWKFSQVPDAARDNAARTMLQTKANFTSSSLLSPLLKLISHLPGVGVLNLFADLKCRLRVVDGLQPFAELVHRQAHFPERVAFAMPVIDPARDRQLLLIAVDGGAVLPQPVVSDAEI